ncbi:MAG: TetR family transcriptional regulator [Myxococcaceae bacterium]|nr:TetR family transcriptional regulator [Myxococcaceae bacterium]
MARKRSDDKRARILQAAVKVFARKGYHGAKVSEIARKADVADGTIYLYFRNKEDVLVCLFDEVMTEHLQAARRDLQELTGAPARLHALAARHLGLLGSNRDLAVVFQVELRQSTKFMERFTASWLRDYLALVGEIVEQGQREGSLRAGLSSKLATKVLFGALDEMVTSWIISGKDYDLGGLAGPVLDLFLHGAAARRKGVRRGRSPAAAGRR